MATPARGIRKLENAARAAEIFGDHEEAARLREQDEKQRRAEFERWEREQRKRAIKREMLLQRRVAQMQALREASE